MSRWTSAKKRPTTAQKRALEREKALAQCAEGSHRFTATFRPGEEVCTICGLVKYCPHCLTENKLPEPYTYAFPRVCVTHEHQKAEVHA